MTQADRLKRQAAERAVTLIENGMRLGLGTGSTARHVLDVIGERRGRGELDDILGVPTSRATESYARQLGIPTGPLDDHPALDLCIDGADEVDPSLELIKGLGGALLWEKIVASAAARLVIVVDESKRVDRLGRRAPLPVEVIPFGWTVHAHHIEALGCTAALREVDGRPFLTDGGHYILDCRFDEGIVDPLGVEVVLQARPGVVESGLFLGMASDVIVASSSGVRHLQRNDAP